MRTSLASRALPRQFRDDMRAEIRMDVQAIRLDDGVYRFGSDRRKTGEAALS